MRKLVIANRGTGGIGKSSAIITDLMNPNFTREMCLVVDFMEARTFENQLANVAKGIHVPKEESLYQRLWILSSFVNGCLEVGVKPVIYCKP